MSKTIPIEYFYNQKRDQYCKLKVHSEGKYIAYGEPATLKHLASLGWRRTTKLKYDRVKHYE